MPEKLYGPGDARQRTTDLISRAALQVQAPANEMKKKTAVVYEYCLMIFPFTISETADEGNIAMPILRQSQCGGDDSYTDSS